MAVISRTRDWMINLVLSPGEVSDRMLDQLRYAGVIIVPDYPRSYDRILIPPPSWVARPNHESWCRRNAERMVSFGLAANVIHRPRY